MLNFIKKLKNKPDSSGLNRKILAVSIVLMLLPLIVLADNVVNNVVVDDTDTFTLGGSTKVGYKIVGTGGDNKPGCNAADGSSAIVTINTTAGVTATPGLLTFTTCNDPQYVEFTASEAGDYSITVSVSDSGPGSYHTTPAAFTLHVLAPEDTTPPVITPNVVGTLGDNGWYVSDVTVSWTVTDSASTITLKDGCDPTTITMDTAGTTLTCSATSAGGTSSQSVIIKRDVTAPSIEITIPADGTNYILNQFVAASYNCNDALSGIANCNGTIANGANIDTSTIGPKSFVVNSKDMAGNKASVTVNYNVIYNWNGFFRPIDNLPTLNQVKAGRAIPIKFSLNGDQGLNIFESGYPMSVTTSCETNRPIDGIQDTFTAGQSSLTYDPIADQYIYVWKTDKINWPGTCRQLVLRLNDDTEHQANFKFK